MDKNYLFTVSFYIHKAAKLAKERSPFLCFTLGPHFDLYQSESTAYLKFAKLQYVSSGFRCRVITGSQMRLY